MYGSEETRAFCCNCKAVTRHRYTLFASQTQRSPRQTGLLERLLSGLLSSPPTGDYRCTQCGTYLHTPDNLD